MAKRKKKNYSIVHKGDLLFYKDYLIYCEGRAGYNKWKFSCPFIPNFFLTKEEIATECKK